MASTTFPTRALTAALFALLAWAATPLTTKAQLPDYLPTDGLVGWWPFNGNANDESGNGNNGTVNGATLTEDREGNPNAAYSFDGVDDIISCAGVDAISGAQQLSVSIWFNTESMVGFDRLLGQEDDCNNVDQGFAIAFGSADSQQLRFLIRNGTNSFCFIQTNVIPSGEWNNLLLIYDGVESSDEQRCRVYLNGQEQLLTYVNGPFPSTLDVSNIDTQLQFGASSCNGFENFYYSGFLDDIAIYNRALTPEEITALYTGIPYVAPCADPTACNFEQEGECVFAQPNLDCAGNCLNDFNNNGVCDEVEVYGCTYAFACNYNPDATADDGSCTVAQTHYDCAGNCLLDLNNNGLCDLEEAAGCTNVDAINYNADATLDDGSCMVTCKGDFDNDGQITINDLLGFLAAFGNQCDGAGCMDPAGCNYDPTATFDLGYCEYPAEFFNCEGSPINDADGDGIPDELEVAGCTDPEAGNYNPEATDDNGSCTFGLTGATHSCGAENVHNPDLVYGSVTDIDGNTYRTIVIGNQEWMAENLTVEHYANGDPIPNVTNDAQWAGLSTGAWCYYTNNQLFECPYGKLYNWYVTIDDRNVCPAGWHVPTNNEWTVLTDHLGGEAVAGGKMKSFGATYWDSPNNWATNETGFSGLPSGSRLFSFENLSVFFSLWSSTESNESNAWHRRMNSDSGDIAIGNPNKESGFAIRCLRD